MAEKDVFGGLGLDVKFSILGFTMHLQYFVLRIPNKLGLIFFIYRGAIGCGTGGT